MSDMEKDVPNSDELEDEILRSEEDKNTLWAVEDEAGDSLRSEDEEDSFRSEKAQCDSLRSEEDEDVVRTKEERGDLRAVGGDESVPKSDVDGEEGIVVAVADLRSIWVPTSSRGLLPLTWRWISGSQLWTTL